jgi:hypothetical protein
VHVERSQQWAARLAGAVQGDGGDLSGGNAAVEAAVEVPWFDRGAMPGREHEASFDPRLADAGAVSILLLPAEFEGRDAQAREGQRCLWGLGLDFAAEELAADALKLLSDIEFTCVEVDQFPGEPEYFALAQAQDQDEDEGGVQRLARMPGWFEKPAGVIDCPGGALPASGLAAIGQFDGADGVPADNLVFDRAGERGPKCIAGILAASRGKYLVAAFANRAAAAFALATIGILTLFVA